MSPPASCLFRSTAVILERWFNTSESMEQGEFLREPETFQMPAFEAIAESTIEGNEAVDEAEDQLRHRRRRQPGCRGDSRHLCRSRP